MAGPWVVSAGAVIGLADILLAAQRRHPFWVSLRRGLLLRWLGRGSLDGGFDRRLRAAPTTHE